MHDGSSASDGAQERGLRDLWRVVKPGGVYIVEGIQGWAAGGQGRKRSFIDFVNGILWEDVMLQGGEVRDIDWHEGYLRLFQKGMIHLFLCWAGVGRDLRAGTGVYTGNHWPKRHGTGWN